MVHCTIKSWEKSRVVLGTDRDSIVHNSSESTMLTTSLALQMWTTMSAVLPQWLSLIDCLETQSQAPSVALARTPQNLALVKLRELGTYGMKLAHKMRVFYHKGRGYCLVRLIIVVTKSGHASRKVFGEINLKHNNAPFASEFITQQLHKYHYLILSSILFVSRDTDALRHAPVLYSQSLTT